MRTRNPDYGCHADHDDDAPLVYGDVLDEDPLATLHAQHALSHNPATLAQFTDPKGNGGWMTAGSRR
jgi:hypothetical protein